MNKIMKSNKIILLGYMGSGKSAVGTKLAKQLGISFVDLDDYIENRERNFISKIFDTKGELYFRALERKCLEELLITNDPLVISLGGGTPCYYDTMDFINLKQEVQSIYLKTGINELTNRLFEQRKMRPMIAHLGDTNQMKEFIGKHLFERAAFYQKAKNQIITDDKTIETVVTEILSVLV